MRAPAQVSLRRVAGPIVVLGLALGAADPSHAQAYPNKPIHFIVPHSVSGSPDILARLLAMRLGEALGQQVVVDNQPGAGGVMGAEKAARAAPDGYTLLTGSSAIVINPSLYPNEGYDVQRDFQGITALASAPLVLVVHPSLPVRSTRELIALARAKPGAIDYASGGSGLHAEIIKILAMPEIKARVSSLGFSLIANTPEAFSAQIKSDLAKWARVIRVSGARVD